MATTNALSNEVRRYHVGEQWKFGSDQKGRSKHVAEIAGLKVTLEEITPEIAEEYLATNTDRQRRVKSRNVRLLARQMAEGRWCLNGQTIVFDESGAMIDGQHRCRACIDADAPFRSLVVRGTSHHVLETIDTGMTRTGADALKIGIDAVGSTHLAAVARIKWLHDTNRPFISTDAATNMEILDTVRDGGVELERAAQDAILVRGKLGPRGLSTSTFAYSLYLCLRGAPLSYDSFIEALISGAGLQETDPRFLLRERLRGMRRISTGSRPAREHNTILLHTVVHAFKAFKSCRRLTKLQPPSGTNSWPRI